jgi:hypothetical protein
VRDASYFRYPSALHLARHPEDAEGKRTQTDGRFAGIIALRCPNH